MKEYPYLSQALGNAIEMFRQEKRMTKSSLAKFARLERRYLREIESGMKKPTVNAVYSICEALTISPIEFFLKVDEEMNRLRCKDNG